MTHLVLTALLATMLSLSALALETNLHMQTTAVTQQHGDFSSPYRGANSLSPGSDSQTSLTWTLFAGARLSNNTEFYIDPEMAGGGGFDKTRGIAGFPNGEIYRVDDASPKWNLARMYLKQVIPLDGATGDLKDGPNQLSGKISPRRVTVAIGKFALNDFFDNNSYSHDPRTQFLNWAFMDHGAWDYAADTRGYSWGLFIEYNEPKWALRLGSVLVPIRANEMELDTNFPAARGDNLEFEYRETVFGSPGVLRILAFENHARMGNYRTTLDTPAFAMDVTNSRSLSIKYGFGVSGELAIGDYVGLFSRACWNDGKTETWAFTEIDQSVSFGTRLKGSLWSRPDEAAFAVLLNGLSQDHSDYLAKGGYGFIVGDGKLNYAPEEIAETYYLFKATSGLQVSGDYQFVLHPAYNADRGPVSIFSLRVHYEI